MDNLELYLIQNEKYNNEKLSNILETKINITGNHIKHIKFTWQNDSIKIIKLFEKYGYIFTEDDYKYILCKNPSVLQYISNDNKTEDICKIAVQKYGLTLQYIPNDKKTDEICELAVRQDGFALKYVPENKKSEELRRIAICKYAKTLSLFTGTGNFLKYKN